MGGAAAMEPLLERSEELARIESALADARAGRGRFLVVEGPAGIGKTALLAATRRAAADAGMRVLRSRGTELEGEFAFGVVRQLFEPELAERPELERTDLLHDAAGEAASLLGLPGARRPEEEQRSAVDPSFAIFHAFTGCARTSRPPIPSASSSTTRTGRTHRHSGTWSSWSRGWKSSRSRSSSPRGPGSPEPAPSCSRR